jgi:hypothetical protein
MFGASVRWLSRQLWFYAAIYALIVVLFAAAFTPMSAQFYHSTVAFEPTTRAFKKRVQEKLERDIKRNISPDSQQVAVGQWKIVTVWVSDIELRDEWLVARTYVYGMSLSPSPGRFEASFNLRISTLGSINTPIYKPGRDEEGHIIVTTGHPIYYVRKADLTNLEVHTDIIRELPIEVSQILPCRSYPVGVSPLCIEAAQDLDKDIEDLIHLLRGQPEPGEGAFWRMLYFSVCTITTLGFGDIVPVTPLARGLVTFEAFLGPLLLGVFLAAVALRLAPGSRSPTGESPSSAPVHTDKQ